MHKSLLIMLASAILAVACSAPKQVPYFQDLDENSTYSLHPINLTLQPDDKISIVVTCKDPQLSVLFNLPYATRTIGSVSDGAGYGSSQGISGYTIDSEGNIDFPILGKLKVAGLTREQVAQKVKYELISRNLVKDPVVTVEYLNLVFSILGEVAHPGRFSLPKDCLDIVDAIALAGDLLVTGKRENVRVIRQEDGRQVTYFLNLCSMQDLVNSPAYYVHQNDIIYVEPNAMKTRQSTVNGNSVLNVSFWMSCATFITTTISSVLVLINRL